MLAAGGRERLAVSFDFHDFRCGLYSRLFNGHLLARRAPRPAFFSRQVLDTPRTPGPDGGVPNLVQECLRPVGQGLRRDLRTS